MDNASPTLCETGQALLGHIDALMPAIERAIAAEWKRGNYINGPQFGGAIEAFRNALASVGRNPEGHDRETGHGRNDEHATGEAGDAQPLG